METIIFLQTQILAFLVGFLLTSFFIYYKYDIKDWIAKNLYEYYSEKTNQIVSNKSFRWQKEMMIDLVLGKKPWYKSYTVNKYKKFKFFGKPQLIDTTYEKIPNSDYIIDEWNNPEKIKNLKKILIQLGHSFPQEI